MGSTSGGFSWQLKNYSISIVKKDTIFYKPGESIENDLMVGLGAEKFGNRYSN
jgi:hypothetical protein